VYRPDDRLCGIQDHDRYQHKVDKKKMVDMVAVFAFNEGVGWNNRDTVGGGGRFWYFVCLVSSGCS